MHVVVHVGPCLNNVDSVVQSCVHMLYYLYTVYNRVSIIRLILESYKLSVAHFCVFI